MEKYTKYDTGERKQGLCGVHWVVLITGHGPDVFIPPCSEGLQIVAEAICFQHDALYVFQRGRMLYPPFCRKAAESEPGSLKPFLRSPIITLDASDSMIESCLPDSPCCITHCFCDLLQLMGFVECFQNMGWCFV